MESVDLSPMTYTQTLKPKRMIGNVIAKGRLTAWQAPKSKMLDAVLRARVSHPTMACLLPKFVDIHAVHNIMTA